MSNDLLNIELIKEYILNKKIRWTNHCLNRLSQRKMQLVDVKNAIITGQIIEYYYDDYPYPSCLILGYTVNKKMIHIVCGMDKDFIYMITVLNVMEI